MVARKAEKYGNSCSARHYDQIGLSFDTAWTQTGPHPVEKKGGPRRALHLLQLNPRFYRHSEIRLVRTRDFGVLSGVVFMRVFGADNLLPLCYQRAPIRFGRRPGHRENAFILDRKMKLKPPALVVGSAVQPPPAR